jgi:hypothetical protein
MSDARVGARHDPAGDGRRSDRGGDRHVHQSGRGDYSPRVPRARRSPGRRSRRMLSRRICHPFEMPVPASRVRRPHPVPLPHATLRPVVDRAATAKPRRPDVHAFGSTRATREAARGGAGEHLCQSRDLCRVRGDEAVPRRSDTACGQGLCRRPQDRVVKEISASGCRTWWTWTYLPDRERFTLASTIAWQTDAAGKPVRNCR